MCRESIWDSYIRYHFQQLRDCFVGMNVGEFFHPDKPYNEFVWEDIVSLRDVGTLHTLCVFRYKRVFLKHRQLQRNVLRITDFGKYGGLDKLYDHRRNSSDNFTQYNGPEPLKCELFSDNPRLHQLAQRWIEPLAKMLGYPRVDYVDMSRDPSAWYPGESPQSRLPKAWLLNA